MKNRFRVILMAIVAVMLCGCEENTPEPPTFLEVTPNNIAGTWALESFDGVALHEGNYVYIEFVRKDRTYKMFQNTDSAYTRVLTGRYNIYTDSEAGSIIRGNYDYGQGDWSARYIVTELTEERMCWAPLNDPSSICVYIRSDIPEDIYSAYVPDVEEEE